MAKTIEGNYLSIDGASLLARRIRDFWFDKGYFQIGVWVEPIKVVMQGDVTPKTLYQVRSNLHNGLPPRLVIEEYEQAVQ